MFKIFWITRDGTHRQETTDSLDQVHRRLELCRRQRIAADAFDVTGDERIRIGQTWKNNGRWTWNAVKGSDSSP